MKNRISTATLIFLLLLLVFTSTHINAQPKDGTDSSDFANALSDAGIILPTDTMNFWINNYEIIMKCLDICKNCEEIQCTAQCDSICSFLKSYQNNDAGIVSPTDTSDNKDSRNEFLANSLNKLYQIQKSLKLKLLLTPNNKIKASEIKKLKILEVRSDYLIKRMELLYYKKNNQNIKSFKKIIKQN